MNRTTTAAILALVLISFACPTLVSAQGPMKPALIITPLTESGRVEYSFKDKTAVATNGVMIQYGEAVLTADRVRVDQDSGEVLAEGRVRLQKDELVWVGENIRYNFFTLKLESEQFRTGHSPIFAGGERVGTPEDDASLAKTNYAGRDMLNILTNQVYTGHNAFITTDDVSDPETRIRASSIKVTPGKSIEARNAVLYVGKVPVFYFPYYQRRLDGQGNHFNFVPGYRSRYGPFLLSSYTWMADEYLDGVLHLDYREKRGAGEGADFNMHLGRWG